MSNNCPVCENEAVINFQGTQYTILCNSCGRFMIDLLVYQLLPANLPLKPNLRPKLRHFIYKMQREGQFPLIDKALFERIDDEFQLPTPTEHAENLVLWLGDNLKENPSRELSSDWDALVPIIGVFNRNDVACTLQNLAERNLVHHNVKGISLKLTLPGWDKYEELQRKKSDSKLAFMAMSFRTEQSHVDEMYRKHFKPAVALTGFELRDIREEAPAGLIDNRLIVEIRRSAFIICDLTGNNAGAYWEAGFATGLDKPVIYTCEKTFFDEQRTHFDTNHHHTVIWESDEPQKAAEDLKATIRATLPEKAVLSDEDARTPQHV